MPTQVLTKDQRHNPMLAGLVPMELTAQRAGDKLRDAERQAIDMNLRFQPAILILPDRGFEGR